MTLRRQLLLVSLLLLSLPWAGCQFIREMEGALRQGQEQSLQATAAAVAAILSNQEELLYPNPARRVSTAAAGSSLYAHATAQPLILDGYGDGWENVDSVRFSSESGTVSVSYRARTRNGNLYLLLQVTDPEVIYHNPGLSLEPNGDRLVLRSWQDNRRQDYVIATAAPGKVRARAAGRRLRGADPGRIRGYWQDAVDGYTLELEVPLSYTGGRLGFYLVDVGSGSGGSSETTGNIRPLDTAAPPWLIYSPQALLATLAPFAGQGGHIMVLDSSRWLIADLPAGASRDQGHAETFWLLQLIYRGILSQDELSPPPAAPAPGKQAGAEIDSALANLPGNTRYRDPLYASRTILSAAAPIRFGDGVMGAVVVRRSGEQYLSLTDQAFSRLLGYSLLALGFGALALLGYASWLSWRIGRLSRAANDAIGQDGQILDTFPRSRAGDEIGLLSRHYADLLDRLREYNDYLRTLSRKLSHELRTPIAVIQTSLENLEQAAGRDESADTYLNRAREGLSRLNSILTAMSEANRLEESVRNNTREEIDLVPLLREVFAAYREIYPAHSLALDIAPERAGVSGAPDLIVQALDKLMDNASSFCPEGGRIELSLERAGACWEIRVSNEGPGLPAELADSLFDPMISLRDSDSTGVHLGLGLHVVRLIVDYHQGQVAAHNLPDGSGVFVSIALPALNAGDPVADDQASVS